VTYDKKNLLNFLSNSPEKRKGPQVYSPFVKPFIIGSLEHITLTHNNVTAAKIQTAGNPTSFKLINFAKNNDPKEIECPLTLEPYKNPLRTPDGQCYSAAPILQWLNQHNTCPLSRQKLERCQLVLDLSLFKLTQAIKNRQRTSATATNTLSK
jgi:hypothetical protein